MRCVVLGNVCLVFGCATALTAVGVLTFTDATYNVWQRGIIIANILLGCAVWHLLVHIEHAHNTVWLKWQQVQRAVGASNHNPISLPPHIHKWAVLAWGCVAIAAVNVVAGNVFASSLIWAVSVNVGFNLFWCGVAVWITALDFEVRHCVAASAVLPALDTLQGLLAV